MVSTAVLTAEQKAHFREHGWLKLPSCFTPGQASEVTSTLWTRLGISDPNDRSQWDAALASHPNANADGRINMPSHTSFSARKFAPKAWSAIEELLAPASITEETEVWRDNFIVNLGSPSSTTTNASKSVAGHNPANGSASTTQPTKPQDLPGWHVDGDFFIHYLDSPEQALLVIPLFTSIRSGGGGTFICPPAIKHVASHLRDHPEGVTPYMLPRAENPGFDPKLDKQKVGLGWFNDLAKRVAEEAVARGEERESAFVEVTGDAGDVYLLHPLMLHSASTNYRREQRVITNPPVAIKQPFRFNRGVGEADGVGGDSGAEISIVAQTTLRALGLGKGLQEWKITEERGEVVPERIRLQREARLEERRRLDALAAGA